MSKIIKMSFEEEWRLGVRVKFQMMYKEGKYSEIPLDKYEEVVNRFLNNEPMQESRPFTPPLRLALMPRLDYHEELATELIYYVRERIRRRRIPIKGLVNMKVMTVAMWGWGRPFLLRTMVLKWRSPPLNPNSLQ